MSELLPIVYAYPCRWDMTPARQRYLMQAMSAHTRVVFLNEPVFNGRFDICKPRVETISSALTVVHGAFGFRMSRIGKRLRRVAMATDARWLHSLLGELGIGNYIYWLAASMPEMLPGMKTRHLVYDCIDPCFDAGVQNDFERVEGSIARQAKVVFATAESLLEQMKKYNDNCHLLCNACSPDEYKPQMLTKLDLPQSLQSRPRPIVGYMGTFDWRVDVQLLYEAARRLPEFTFALAGRINYDQMERVAPLKALPNVVMPGSISVEEGQKFTAAFDLGLIPFLPGAMGDGINPVKMYMYLVAGKPVVSTWIRECRRHAPYVAAARNADEFVAAIRAAADPNAVPNAADRTAFAMKNSWATRAQYAAEVLRQAGFVSEDRVEQAVA